VLALKRQLGASTETVTQKVLALKRQLGASTETVTQSEK